jgi:hypothetical protein
VKEPTRSNVQTETHISTANNSLSRIPSFGPKKGLATKLPIQSASASTHAVTSLQHRTGERYKNLRHMNNAMKFARRERTPDIRELDLRAPGDFAMPRSIQEVQELDASSSKREESPLFVPETIPEAPPEVETESHFLPARSPSPADVPQAGEKSKALVPTSISGAKSPSRGGLKESAHARQGVSQPSSPVREPIRSTQASRVGRRPREPSKERPVVATRPQAVNSSLASIARRDDFTSSRKPAELSEGNVEASRISIPTSASGRPIYGSFKDRPLGQPGQLFTARNGRSWYWGELVVLVRYGAHQVGHVKILGFPGSLIARLISAKQGPDLEMHFEERNVMGQIKFSAFASQVSPTWYPGVQTDKPSSQV